MLGYFTKFQVGIHVVRHSEGDRYMAVLGQYRLNENIVHSH